MVSNQERFWLNIKHTPYLFGLLICGLFLLWISTNITPANYAPNLHQTYLKEAETELNIVLEPPSSTVYGNDFTLQITNNNNLTIRTNSEWMVEGLGGGFWVKQKPVTVDTVHEWIEVPTGTTISLDFDIGSLSSGIYLFTSKVDYQDGSKHEPIRFIVERGRMTM